MELPDSPRKDPAVIPLGTMKAVVAAIRVANRQPPLLWEEFTIGTVPKATTLNKSEERVGEKVHVGRIHKRYVLWAQAEDLSLAQMTIATEISHDTCQRIIVEAQKDTKKFMECGFVMEVRAGLKGNVKKYLCRYCGWAYSAQIDAHKCAWVHCFGEAGERQRGGYYKPIRGGRWSPFSFESVGTSKDSSRRRRAGN